MTHSELHDEEGTLATEAALLMPLAFFVLFLVVQFGLWMYANIAVDQAATHAVQTLAVTGGDVDDTDELATNAALAVISDVNGVKDVQVNGTIVNYRGVSDAYANVHVRGEAVVLFPGIDWRVDSRKRAPIEQFLNIQERCARDGGC